MVVIDSTFLLLILRPDTPIPPGRGGTLVESPRERIAYLIQQFDKTREKIIIPAPALTEALVRLKHWETAPK